ncbi:glycosyltransferase involved in cell wall biosynthesis [Flavobacterium sp. 2755]|uniref:glycosyltransferase n=1 Tax=Flavobacterium sp. 2755 TaxID=2817765 RepID=UPI00285D993E|nr:glycosyltransferase [Flavobacterium sp. 2755]MDR6760629.1 glycosyltransferase involved in cell wall biosynthesis [Flavobacterium sp. 2755]
MRILQVINSLYAGGAEKLLLETIPLYNKKGVEVDLLVLDGTDYPFMKALKEANCCKIYSLGTTAYNPLNVFKIMPFLKKYDIVHVHLFPSQYWIVLSKILSFSRIKIIVTEHNTTNPRLENFFLSKIDWLIYKMYGKIICITDEVYKIMQDHLKTSKSKLTVIHNGINLDIINDAQPYAKNEISNLFSDNDILLIQVARFSKQKDQQTVINALQYLPENIKLILVGNGVLQKDCEALVEKLNLEGRVIFLGIRMDVPRLLKTADITVLSTNWEGLSLSAIESMNSGKPFIASNVAGMSDLINGSGILFEKGNHQELAFYIKKLINEKDFYEVIVNSCKKRAKQFDIQSMVEKHIDLYESMIKK